MIKRITRAKNNAATTGILLSVLWELIALAPQIARHSTSYFNSPIISTYVTFDTSLSAACFPMQFRSDGRTAKGLGDSVDPNFRRTVDRNRSACMLSSVDCSVACIWSELF